MIITQKFSSNNYRIKTNIQHKAAQQERKGFMIHSAKEMYLLWILIDLKQTKVIIL
jgi:hypothetical protein